MFWRKKVADAPQDGFRIRGNALAAELLATAQVDFDAASQLQQALIGTFLFGVLTAEGMSRQLSPHQIRAGAISVFQDTLHYTAGAALEGVDNCIQATGPNVHDTMSALIHRGIDGHRQIASGDVAGLADNIREIFRQFEARS